MIKINLLDSVTDRTKSVAVVEAKVANPRARMMMLAGATCALLLIGVAFDWFHSNAKNAEAKEQLAKQEQIKAQMEAVNKEQAELEKKLKDIQARIEAIRKLRASQKGPVAVLSAVNERLPSIIDFRLDSIEQKNGELVIMGHSPNEGAVTQFGRSLEFSSGLFANVNIETERATLAINTADYKDSLGPIDMTAPAPETVKFKIKCKYNEPMPSAAPHSNAATPATASNQIAQK